MFTICVFGTTTAHLGSRVCGLDDLPGGKPRQLLEILALARGAVVPKSRLVDMLWPVQPPARVMATLETYIAVLRRALQPGVPGRETMVRTVAGGYRLDGTVRLDLDVFDDLVAGAERAGPATAVEMLGAAARMAARDVLERDPLVEEGWQALIAAHGRAGRPAEVVRAFRACRHALITELGAYPSGLTDHVVRMALNGSPTVVATSA